MNQEDQQFLNDLDKTLWAAANLFGRARVTNKQLASVSAAILFKPLSGELEVPHV